MDDGTPPPAEDNDVPEDLKDVLGDISAVEDVWSQVLKDALTIAALKLDPVQLPRVVPANFTYQPPPNRCATQPTPGFCVELPRSPFQGKDIIYVHGLSTEVLKAVVEGGEPPNWGFGLPNLTYLAYFAARADQQWDQHIKRFLVPRNANNRFMIVGWSSAQRIEYAANAMLYQIADAMVNGTRVVNKPNDPRGKAGFCAYGCVIVSHSTGALITDVAMSLADNANYQQNYGNIGFIPQRVNTHVSLGGAFVGSKYATLAVGLGRGVLAIGKVACTVGGLFTGISTSDCEAGLYDPISQSILVDLMPLRAYNVWGPVIRQSKVKTLTVAGGNHESLWPLKKFFLKGFDDGVVNMDSACARDLAPGDWVAGTGPTGLPSLWDRGMSNLIRSARFYAEQVKEPILQLRAASGCTPYKTPWGMLVGPIWNLKKNPMGFFPNHYAFMQTAENHGGSRRWFSQEDGLQGGEQHSLEDVRANHDDSIYTLNLVDTSMKNAQVESIRGRAIRFRLFGKRHKVYIWKRTYHRLTGWGSSSAADYVYRFVR